MEKYRMKSKFLDLLELNFHFDDNNNFLFLDGKKLIEWNVDQKTQRDVCELADKDLPHMKLLRETYDLEHIVLFAFSKDKKLLCTCYDFREREDLSESNESTLICLREFHTGKILDVIETNSRVEDIGFVNDHLLFIRSRSKTLSVWQIIEERFLRLLWKSPQMFEIFHANIQNAQISQENKEIFIKYGVQE